LDQVGFFGKCAGESFIESRQCETLTCKLATVNPQKISRAIEVAERIPISNVNLLDDETGGPINEEAVAEFGPALERLACPREFALMPQWAFDILKNGILAFGNSNLKRALRFSYDVLHAVVFLLDNLAPPWLTPNGRKWLGFKPALTEEAGMPSFAAAPEDRDSRCSSLYQVRTPLAASEGQLSYDRSIHLGQSGGARCQYKSDKEFQDVRPPS